MLTERSIINFLIWVGGLILGPYLVMSALSLNLAPILSVVAICFLVFVFGIGKDRICLLPLLGTFWAGRLNFLPLKLAPADTCALALLLYYFIAYLAVQRKAIKTGPAFFYLPILIIGAILLYHEHNFGLRSVGNGREGSRGAVFMLVACLGYLCGVSVNTPSPVFFRRFPFYCVLAVVFSTIPYVVTTYLPSTAPYFWRLTDNINGSAFTSDVLNEGGIVRNQGQEAVGTAGMVYLISYYPLFTWWRPSRWWVALLGLGCCALVVMGGYRSAFVVFGFTILVGSWCYYSWRSFILLPPAVLAIFLATAAQDSHLVHLPLSAQRSLAFLPGDWDVEVMDNTLASNDFRQKIQHVYLQEDAAKSPFLGNGTSYDSDTFERFNDLAKTHETPDGYYQTKIFVTGKMFHIGWISVYDAVGLVGSAAFVFFLLSFVWVSGRMVFRASADRKSPLFPLKVWMLCNTLPAVVGYFTVYGDLKLTFPVFCYYAILWTQLDRLERLGYSTNTAVREVAFDPMRTDASIPTVV